MTIEELQQEFESLAGCCLHDLQWTPDDVAEVLCTVWNGDGSGGWKPGEKECSDSNSCTVVRLKDGRFGLLDEWEDYTGHGCQCGSATAVYASMRELLEMGVPDEDARTAIRQETAIPGQLARDNLAIAAPDGEGR